MYIYVIVFGREYVAGLVANPAPYIASAVFLLQLSPATSNQDWRYLWSQLFNYIDAPVTTTAASNPIMGGVDEQLAW